MIPSAYDLKIFYNASAGRMLRRVIRARIEELWPLEDKNNLNMVGLGYAVPYLRPYMAAGANTHAFMPIGQGAHFWPPEGPNKAALCPEWDLPLETNSVDRMLMIHGLEFMPDVTPAFEEIWRVLKSSGKLLLIVPNRMGLWARADWSPFGQGTPYSSRQIESFLMENLFVHERTTHGLFVPPFKRDFLLRAAGGFERVGRVLCPAMGGLHMIEASKQLYAGKGKAVRAGVKKTLLPNPVPAGVSNMDRKKL